MPAEQSIVVTQQFHLEQVRRLARSMATAAGFDTATSEEWALVATELASNLIRHTPEGGSISFSAPDQPGRIGIRLVAEDSGPGIESVDEALQEGFSTSGGLGGGLPAMKRLSDELAIQSSRTGTRITVTRWRTR